MPAAGDPRLVLLRHGESVLNAGGVFTGLLDVRLTPAGEEQVGVAARLLAERGLRPGLIVTPPMLRALRTPELLLAGLAARDAVDADVPRVVTWRLCERDYGALTGLAKADARALLGEHDFFALRRTIDGRPPPASAQQRAAWPATPVADRGPLMPGAGESLADVIGRVTPVWTGTIRPALASGTLVVVVAHGNSLRALASTMEQLTAEETERLNIPAGHPLAYGFDGARPTPPGGRYLDARAGLIAAERVAAEGGT